MTNAKTLVNFNISKTTLSAFDQLCRLNGKPRSIILNDLIYYYILEAGSKIPMRLNVVAEIDRNLKNAVKTSFETEMNDQSEYYKASLEGALKSILETDINPLFDAMEDI